MIWIAILVALLISAAAVAAVAWPLLKPGPAPVIVESDELTDLLYRKDATLSAIKELEFDYRVGKLSQEDYERFDQGLRRQAIALMQQVEKLTPQSAELDAALEAEIAHHRKVVEQAGQQQGTSPIPAQPAAAVTSSVQAAPPPRSDGALPRFCTNCGNALEPQHKFCANCGTPVATPVAAVSE